MKQTCQKCREEFEDENYNQELPLAKRIFCNKCVDKKWGKESDTIFNEI